MGTVIDEADEPQPGTRVSIEEIDEEGTVASTWSRNVSSGADGSFRAQGLRDGPYAVRVTQSLVSEGRWVDRHAVARCEVAGGRAPALRLKLGGGVLSGRVVDGPDAGVPGAVIKIVPEGMTSERERIPAGALTRTASTESAVDGRFAVQGLPPAATCWTCKKRDMPTYLPRSWPFRARARLSSW